VIGRGGSAGAALMLSNIEQVADQLAACGVTSDQASRFSSLMKDPDFAFMMPVMVSARGRRVAA
jgi:hypothetical protein